jgi:two-component system response regulator AtoC
VKKNILIIDDEVNICSSLTYVLEDNFNIFSNTNPFKALELLSKEDINLILLDLRIGKTNGIDILKKIKAENEQAIVIMMTAYGTIESTVEAMRNGAFTYLTKPLNIEELLITINQGLEYQSLSNKVNELNNQLIDKYSYKGLVGKSPEMQNIFELIEKVRDVDINVLITGESGTGKDLIARAIHYSGNRSKENFVEINCAAIPEGLLESELFGHKKGAFTGADKDKIGKFEYAKKGTILLDEIGDMSLNLQAKLLRVLEQKEFSPLGSNDIIKLEARVIAATNRNLKRMIKEKGFRQDLYFRLNVVEIDVPPLRNRRQDLPLLFNHFIKLYNEKLGKNVVKISKNAEKLLLKYLYPGNIRELSNILEYAVLLSENGAIEESDLPDEVRLLGKINASEYELDSLLGLTLKDIERKIIEATLELNEGRRNDTARMLGISDRGLRNKINEYKLK